MADEMEYPTPPDFEGAELEKARAAGHICKNCIYWGPNADPTRDWDRSRARCFGDDMNSFDPDHVPNTEPDAACGDFQHYNEKRWFRIAFSDMAAMVEASTIHLAYLKALGMCGKKHPTHYRWSLVYHPEENKEKA